MEELKNLKLFEKHYDSDKTLSLYYTPESGFFDDSVMVPIKHLVRLFASGAVKGDTLIQYGGNHNISMLFPACDYFKEIILVDFVDSKLQIPNKWLKKEAGSFDWSPIAKFVCELEGNRDKWIDKEEKLRRTIQKLIKVEFFGTHSEDPKLSAQADCLFSSHCLEFLSDNRDAYCRALKCMSSLIKIGGWLVLVVPLGCTFAMNNQYKFPVLCMDAEFVTNTVVDAGFVIKECHVTPRANVTKFATCDFSDGLFLVACKEKDVQ